MAVGQSVSNGTLWDTRWPPRGNLALPSMEALLGGPYNSPLLGGPYMENMAMNLEQKESSATWAHNPDTYWTEKPGKNLL